MFDNVDIISYFIAIYCILSSALEHDDLCLERLVNFV